MWILSILVRENGLTLKHWNRMTLVVFKCRNSPREYYDTVKKFIEKIIGAVHYDQVVDECRKKQIDNTAYWSVDLKKDFVNASHWSIGKWISVLAKGGGQEKVSILLESELSSSILVPSSNWRTFRKYYQSCFARQCIVTRRFYRVFF